MYHFFALITRMRHINRWGLMHNTFPENVAEHSLITAILAHSLAIIRRDIYGEAADPDACAAAALFHDASEILTGDLPTPVKYWSPSIRKAYQEVEKHSADRLLDLLPDEMRESYQQCMTPRDSGVRELVHAADKLAAYLKSTEEVRAGNSEFMQAMRQTREKLESMEMKEVVYFLQYFYPGFTLTLDELQ